MSEMLHEGRIPLAEAEHAAVDKLIEKHPDASVSFSRRDPNESGPLVVGVGDDTYIVQADGKTRKQAS